MGTHECIHLACLFILHCAAEKVQDSNKQHFVRKRLACKVAWAFLGRELQEKLSSSNHKNSVFELYCCFNAGHSSLYPLITCTSVHLFSCVLLQPLLICVAFNLKYPYLQSRRKHPNLQKMHFDVLLLFLPEKQINSPDILIPRKPLQHETASLLQPSSMSTCNARFSSAPACDWLNPRLSTALKRTPRALLMGRYVKTWRYLQCGWCQRNDLVFTNYSSSLFIGYSLTGHVKYGSFQNCTFRVSQKKPLVISP